MNLPNTITLFSAPHDVEWECRETNAGRKMAVTRIFPRNHAFVAASGIHTYWMTNGKEDYLSTHAAFVAVAREIRDQLAASNLTIVGTFAHATILGIAVFSDDTGPTG